MRWNCGFPVRILPSLQLLAVRLQAVAEPVQQAVHAAPGHSQALRAQRRRQLGGTESRPAERAHRITARDRIQLAVQGGQQFGIALDQPLAPASRYAATNDGRPGPARRDFAPGSGGAGPVGSRAMRRIVRTDTPVSAAIRSCGTAAASSNLTSRRFSSPYTFSPRSRESNRGLPAREDTTERHKSGRTVPARISGIWAVRISGTDSRRARVGDRLATGRILDTSRAVRAVRRFDT